MAGMQDDAAEAEVVQANTGAEAEVVHALVGILRANRGAAAVPSTVMELYRADARFKDIVKNKLGGTVIDVLARHPEHFALDANKKLVALATGDSSAHVYTVEVCDDALSTWTGCETKLTSVGHVTNRRLQDTTTRKMLGLSLMATSMT